mgnify:CR=1 FL=1
MSIKPVNLRALCERTVERLKPLWQPRGIKMTVNFSASMKTIPGDEALLSQALNHLVNNAILFNRPGGSVRIEGVMDLDEARLTFSDTGEGIPESEFAKIFDSFYQVANFLTRKVDGIGLGLSITRRIVEAHGGHIRVMSKLNEGTTFTVRLPVTLAAR